MNWSRLNIWWLFVFFRLATERILSDGSNHLEVVNLVGTSGGESCRRFGGLLHLIESRLWFCSFLRWIKRHRGEIFFREHYWLQIIPWSKLNFVFWIRNTNFLCCIWRLWRNGRSTSGSFILKLRLLFGQVSIHARDFWLFLCESNSFVTNKALRSWVVDRFPG